MSTLAPTRPRIPGSGRVDPPPLQEHGDGGGGRDWVELTRARNDIEAHLLTGRLQVAGVETTTIKDRNTQGAFLYGGQNPWAPVAVLVRRFQVDEARIVLAELAFEGPSATPTVERTGRWPGALLWWAAALGLAVAFTVLGIAQMIERCERSEACREAMTSQEQGGAGSAGPQNPIGSGVAGR